MTLETRLIQAARTLNYPPTPRVANAVVRRLAAPARPRSTPKWATAAVVGAFLLALVLSVPTVRAGLVEFLQIGGVRFWFTAPTPTPMLPAQPTPLPMALADWTQVVGEATLEAAQNQLGKSLPPLQFPSDLGPPDKVYVQRLGRRYAVLVWLDKVQPEQVRLTLFVMGPGVIVDKIEPIILASTSVNGQPALWTDGPYLLEMKDGDMAFTRLVRGHVLVWERDSITYRLESELSLEEAVTIAEALGP